MRYEAGRGLIKIRKKQKGIMSVRPYKPCFSRKANCLSDLQALYINERKTNHDYHISIPMQCRHVDSTIHS